MKTKTFKNSLMLNTFLQIDEKQFKYILKLIIFFIEYYGMINI